MCAAVRPQGKGRAEPPKLLHRLESPCWPMMSSLWCGEGGVYLLGHVHGSCHPTLNYTPHLGPRIPQADSHKIARGAGDTWGAPSGAARTGTTMGRRNRVA